MTQETQVLFNGACPVCSREINHYRKLSRKQALAIRYDSLEEAAHLSDWGLSAESAAKRLHVRKDGKIYAGVPAFVALWQEIPQMRWLARAVSLPGVMGVTSVLYDHILAPALYRWHVWRLARDGGVNPPQDLP